MAKLALITFVTLKIDRDANTKSQVTVPEWEQSILEQIHGEANVVELSSEEVEVPNFDASAAFEALSNKYRTSAEGTAARERFVNRPRDLERFVTSRQVGRQAAATGGAATGKAPAQTASDKTPAPPKPRANSGAAKKAKGAADAAAVETEEGAGEEEGMDAAAVADLLAGDVEAIVGRLPGLTDVELIALEAAETEGAGREDLLAAIDDETESRK